MNTTYGTTASPQEVIRMAERQRYLFDNHFAGSMRETDGTFWWVAHRSIFEAADEDGHRAVILQRISYEPAFDLAGLSSTRLGEALLGRLKLAEVIAGVVFSEEHPENDVIVKASRNGVCQLGQVKDSRELEDIKFKESIIHLSSINTIETHIEDLVSTKLLNAVQSA